MRYSKLFGKTVRNAPKDATFISHQLLFRAGYIREVVAGRYILTPLGLRVEQKIIGIIDGEMEKIGSQRVILPTLHPLEIWQATHRDTAWGEDLMKLKDRRGAELVVGATAEGLMVELVKMFNPTYKDLPIVIHQFSQKFRDELRARGGLLRLREFLMKDAYSFATDEESFLKTYYDQYHAYERIAERLDLKAVPVLADSGALGGDFCHEFMVPVSSGEDRILACDKCDYKANVEKAEFVRDEVNMSESEKPLEKVSQPEWVETMADNEKHYGLPARRFLKNVVYKTGKGKIIIAVIRGDLDINERKLVRLIGEGELRPATEPDLKKLGTRSGWVHSWGHPGAFYVGDHSLKTVRNFIGGQKEKETDMVNVNYGRDFKVELLGDIALAPSGAGCPKCQGQLQELKTMEFGHCFKYDDFYTKAQGGTFVDKDGKEKFMQMGAYGIGVERALALIVETHHDGRGIIWPAAVSPYQVHLINLNSKFVIPNSEGKDGITNNESGIRAEEVYEQLNGAGIEVLYDDRDGVSAGEKFADADLIGIPVRLVVSEKSLAGGGVEWKLRNSQETKIVKTAALAGEVSGLLAAHSSQ
ncbi:MAG: proline--tRNA ligase, partial [Patescibacteria group bacterium]